MHGTFMLGLTGDRMIEIAASFTILLVLTGLFLWWPRSGKTLRESLRIGKNKGRILLLLVRACLGQCMGWIDDASMEHFSYG